MLLPEISAAMDVTREKRRRDADRRAQEPRVGEPETAAPVVEDNPSYDAAYYASRMKSEIWRLGVFAEEPAPEPDREGDARLFSFFGHLSVLLLAVRDGDIERARAAADALKMEAMTEPGAEWALGPAAAPWLGDLGRLLRAPDLRGEPATPPDADLADAPAGSIAYDTLTHYLTDDARNL